jgi:ABC-type arginine/histidine transport system permease subunit
LALAALGLNFCFDAIFVTFYYMVIYNYTDFSKATGSVKKFCYIIRGKGLYTHLHLLFLYGNDFCFPRSPVYFWVLRLPFAFTVLFRRRV